ncbi:MAG: alpha-L-fucosidase [Pontiella sp.]
MKRMLWIMCVAAVAMGLPTVTQAEEVATPGQGKDQIAAHDARMAWWRDAKFGCFVHWGVYSELEGVWKGKSAKGYAEHIQRSQKITQEEYKKAAVEKFNPESFDADQWIKMMKEAGMRYLIITAKHHDGFAMYDSQVSDYNIVKATPFRRDPMRELRDACTRQGMRFGFYYSHAFDWGDPNGPGNDWEWENPGGSRNLFGGRNWWETHPELLPNIRKNYVDKKSIPQIRELLLRYHPDIMWFDTPHKLPPEENQRILDAVRKTAPNVVVNGRLVRKSFFDGGGDYINTCDRPAEFYPVDGDWEAIPTTNESYGYHKKDKSHKSVDHFIKLISKASARGGNLLMNIGPKGDGTIDEADRNILHGIGAWMQINGTAIYSSRKTTLPVHAWGQSTRKGNTLYLHIHDFPKDNVLMVGGLKTAVTKAWILSDKSKRPLEVQTSGDIRIQLPASLASKLVPVVVLECAGAIECDPVRLVSNKLENRFHVYDGQLKGGELSYGAGKTRDSYVKNWTMKEEYVLWRNRLESPGEFKVYVEYDADKEADGNRYTVRVGDQTFTKNVVPGSVNKRFLLGSAKLKTGSLDIKVQGEEMKFKKLFNLRAVILEPVGSSPTTRKVEK